MKHSSIPSAQILVQSCKALDISRVVISPGSRNAPLILGFTEDSYFSCYSIVDERSAGFFALGMVRASGSPVLLVCTSGSALLNYYPALAEAYYSELPLIVVSADRPSYKVDIGDGQTIRQNGIFSALIEVNVALDQDVSHASAEYHKCLGLTIPPQDVLKERQQLINLQNENRSMEALRTGIQNMAPVHINIPFEEPLYKSVKTLSYTPQEQESKLPVATTPGNSDAFFAAWEKADRKMILIGQSHESLLDLSVCEQLGKDPSILVFTETTSNTHHPSFFPSIDSIIAPLEKLSDIEQYFNSLRPELLITLGGQIVSKKIKAFLRKYQPSDHWHLGVNKPNNTFFAGVKHLDQKLSESLMEGMNMNGSSSYRSSFEKIREKYKVGRKKYLDQIPFSDFTVFSEILASLPPGIDVHFANSSAIRYAQLFDMRATNKVYCNRGTSGIEGCTSTAIGASVVSEQPTLLISGDLGFLYDINALWNEHLRASFRMIVINNGGGGIFRILPGKDDSEAFEKFFETTHQRNCKQSCEDHDIAYESVSEMEKLSAVLSEFYQASDRPKLLEIFTPRVENDKILLAYFDFLSSEITK